MEARTNGWMHGMMRWTDGCVFDWMNERIWWFNGWMVGLMDGINGWMDGY